MIKNGIVVRIPETNTGIEFQDTRDPLLTLAPCLNLAATAFEKPNRVLTTREFTLDGLGPVIELTSHVADWYMIVCVNEGKEGFKVGLYRLPRDVTERQLPDTPDEVIGRFETSSIESTIEYLETVTARINVENEDLRQIFAATGQEFSINFDEIKSSNSCA